MGNKNKRSLDCHNCRRPITKAQNKIQCAGNCEGWYHKSCSGLSEEKFKDQELNKAVKKWVCNNCCEVEDTSSEDELNERPNPKTSKDGHRKSYHFDFEAVFEHPKPRNLELLKAMKGMFEEMKSCFSFNNGMIEDLTSNLNKITKENKQLKKEQSVLRDRVSDLEQEIINLKAAPNLEEIEERSKNIVVVGLNGGPNIRRDIKKIISKLQMDISEEDYTLKTIPGNGEKKPVIVSFSQKTIRDQVLKEKKMKILDTVSCGVTTNNPTRIFLNEDLPKHTRELFKKARELKKFGFKYVWCKEGKIFARRSDKDSIKTIFTSVQIADLIDS